MRIRRGDILIAILALAVAGALVLRFVFPGAWHALRGRRTLEAVLAEIGPRHRAGLTATFDAAGCDYPAPRVTLIALKRERLLEVWALDRAGQWAIVADYPILAASGGDGPKLAEGDRQVPEGLYRIDLLNPASSYHLSMRLNYPNDFDRQMADDDGRTGLGGDIYIHGAAGSVGCLAMGDAAIEPLFLICHDSGLDAVDVILAPCDLRRTPPPATRPAGAPPWLDRLYRRIHRELSRCRRPTP